MPPLAATSDYRRKFRLYSSPLLAAPSPRYVPGMALPDDGSHDPQQDDEHDHLAGARGILIWTLVSAALIVVLLVVLWYRS
jgi:hypothetical protein